jgi:hypothetical protein
MELRDVTLGVVMPVWLQEQSVLALTLKSLSTLKTQASCQVYVVPSRLRVELIQPHELQQKIVQATGVVTTHLLYVPNLERSVAGCWNSGISRAIADGADYILIYANDVMLEPNTVDTLIEFGMQHPEIVLWSAFNVRGRVNFPVGEYGPSADFCCFMLRPATFVKHGTFDEKYRPAYFEDNDYYARIILGDEHCGHVYSAKVDHLMSMTIKSDPDAAQHCRNWFSINQQRFFAKWQTSRVANTPDEIRQLYAKHPWGDTSKPLSWWERD